MLELFLEHVYFKTARMRTLGWLLFHTGGLLFLAGLLGRLVLAVQEGAWRLSHAGAGSSAPPGLDVFFPDWPTWWIPEGPLGFGIASVLVVTSLMSLSWARQISKYLERAPSVARE